MVIMNDKRGVSNFLEGKDWSWKPLSLRDTDKTTRVDKRKIGRNKTVSCTCTGCEF